jgi:uncharacterized membrane protein YccC
MRRRLPLLLAFIVVGGVFLGGFGLLRSLGVTATVAVAAPTLFACAYLRVWGQPTQALGNLLSVVMLLGTDAREGFAQAGLVAGVFMAGGAWALLLTLVIWRIYPYGPARRAVADVWAEMARLTRMVQLLSAAHARQPDWEGQARSGRGGVREAIERAREILMDTVDRRGAASGPAAQNLLRLEAAEQVFVALIGLSDVLEQADTATRDKAVGRLKRLRALLVVMARATERERLDRLARFERTLTSLTADADAETHAAGAPALANFMALLADRLRLAAKYVDPAQYLPGSGPQGESGLPFRQRVAGPFHANLSWQSATLRHAARIAVVVTAALAATMVWHTQYTHWLTITLVLLMQPFFATTWQRTLERVAGTLLGGFVAGGLSAMMRSTVHMAGLLPVLGALALAVRQVSYGVYIAVYTPTVILLVDSIQPGQSQLHIALARAEFTVLGGLIAVAANFLLWPTWEPDRVRQDLAAAVAAHAAYAEAVLAPGAGMDAEKARRAAGLASNNLEAGLARAMQEPRRGQRDRLQAVLVADATLRRIAGRLVAISLSGGCSGPVCLWVVAALKALAEGRAVPPRPGGSGGEMPDRLARQVSVLPEIILRVDANNVDLGPQAPAGSRGSAPGLAL